MTAEVKAREAQSAMCLTLTAKCVMGGGTLGKVISASATVFPCWSSGVSDVTTAHEAQTAVCLMWAADLARPATSKTTEATDRAALHSIRPQHTPPPQE